MTALTVIILTQDEAQHIARAIGSVQDIATRIIVVDSGSTDETVQLAKARGAQVLHHPWVNHAAQFNWALDQIRLDDTWVLRLDADEVITPELRDNIAAGLPDVDGIFLKRRIHFMGQPVRYGGVFPTRTLRLFRNGMGRAEQKWMDEHIVVEGRTAQLVGEIIDDNRKPLDWWISKHNKYASREVVDLLLKPDGQGAHKSVKRWIKDNLYARLPGGLRAGCYFFYRFVLRLGFLDGPQARAFHVLQGFWYRYLVDAKLGEVRRYMTTTGTDPHTAIHDVLGIDLTADIERKAA